METELARSSKSGTFKGTRVRLQRVRDARFFSGWTLELDGCAIVVRILRTEDMADGDEFFVQVFGAGQNLSTQAVCRLVGVDWARLEFSCDPRRTPASEEVRLAGTGVWGSIRHAWGAVDLEVTDVSPGGVGGIVPFELAKGDEVGLDLATPSGLVQASGTVRYCRPDMGVGGFRVGLSVRIGDRTMLGRWRRQFLHVA